MTIVAPKKGSQNADKWYFPSKHEFDKRVWWMAASVWGVVYTLLPQNQQHRGSWMALIGNTRASAHIYLDDWAGMKSPAKLWKYPLGPAKVAIWSGDFSIARPVQDIKLPCMLHVLHIVLKCVALNMCILCRFYRRLAQDSHQQTWLSMQMWIFKEKTLRPWLWTIPPKKR